METVGNEDMIFLVLNDYCKCLLPIVYTKTMHPAHEGGNVLIWVTADTHFGHSKLLSYRTRPFPTVEIMDGVLISNWNSLISPSDVVIHLGDVFICPADREREIMDQLNGVKILVKGNHDKRATIRYKELGFVEVYNYPIMESGIVLSHYPEGLGEYGCKKTITASYSVRRKAFKGVKGDVLNICGHVHGFTKKLSLNHYCASVENTNYCPVVFSKVKDSLISKIQRMSYPRPHF